MQIPLSWLKKYVDIKIPFKDLAGKLSEAGLTVEKWEEKDGDIIFDPEVTPNRPDWLSVYGIAREIAAITNSKLKEQSSKSQLKTQNLKNPLEIEIVPNYKIVPRITSVIIRNVSVKPSPEWLQKRIKQIGLRPINNLVDITNYVLWLYGGLLHVFDYDKIHGHQMIVTLAQGGEAFRSLDGLDYNLPKGAIIIKDADRIIDLLPLKGGENTSSTNRTKNVLLHSVVVDPVITRRTSQSLGLRSDSSAVAERGLDPNSTPIAVKTALQLILECAGGQMASEIIDHKEKEFKPWVVKMGHLRQEEILGIKISPPEVKNIFERLKLKTTIKKLKNDSTYYVTIPTFRNDLHIEEDLIEEIGRIYGYNNFPKTLPFGPIPTSTVAYVRNYDLEYEIKQILASFGYSEIYTYSLISEEQLNKLGIDSTKVLRVDNPISKDYEYLRPKLLGNLLEALKNNLPNFDEINLFELGKIYQGETLNKVNEKYSLSGIISGTRFYEAKGVIEALAKDLQINCNILPANKQIIEYWDQPNRAAEIVSSNRTLGYLAEINPIMLTRWGIKERAIYWEINYELLEKLVNKKRVYRSLPNFPATTEDLTFTILHKVLVGDIMTTIKEIDDFISTVSFIGVYENNYTFNISYQSLSKTLTGEEVAKIREKIIKVIKEKFQASLKS